MTKLSLPFVVAFFLTLILIPDQALGFAEMVRHGFTHCITCHQSPTGGGLMTDYGRSISAELLSTSTSPGEERFAYLMNPSEIVNLGGDFRGAQFYQNRSTIKTMQTLLMQADVEGSVSVGQISATMTAGVDFTGTPISRRHYVIYRPNENLSVRAGRFLSAFGINIENHSIATRKGVGRNQTGETYNLEAAWFGDSFDLFATAIFGRPDDLNLGAETGAALSSGMALGDSYKVGLSYYYGSRDISKRHLFGPYAILGFTKRFYLMFDLAYQLFTPLVGALTGAQQQGLANYARLDYELLQGLHVYLAQELTQLDFNKASTASEGYGIGIQWFPRPHFEFNLLWQKQRIGGGSGKFADFAFLLGHFYL